MSFAPALPRTERLPIVARISPYLNIARFDHWVKNVFVLPGVVLSLSVFTPRWQELVFHLVIGMLAVGCVASSNYVLNEVMDAPFDRCHPTKRLRPVASRRVYLPCAFAEWLFLGALGLGHAKFVSGPLVWTLMMLW